MKFLLAGIVIFIIATVQSCNETRYKIWGTTVQATSFTKREVEHHSRRGYYVDLLVQYQFDDAGKVRKEEDSVSLDFAFPHPNAVTIQYIPGTEDSRISGHDQAWWIWVFLGSIGLLVWQCVKFWKFYKS